VSTQSEREAFLKLLAENEDDTTARLVFADWLDDHGEHEEADRQRKWPAAKQWLVSFCQWNNPRDDLDPDEKYIPYKTLLELALDAVANADEHGYGFSCGNNMTMCDALRVNRDEFWKNWSIVTGIPLPEGENNRGFSCAC
jgi:uncharacterized protein (TIGR02996 family)